MLKRALPLFVLGLAAFQASAFAQAARPASSGFVNMIDHIHLGVTDQVKAAEWYHKHFAGQPTPEGTDRVMFGQTRMIFQLNKAPKPSDQSVLRLLGFSVANVDETVKQLEADGVKVDMPPMVMGGVKMAQVEDPWGTLIEVVQDPQKLGLHHIGLLTADPAKTLAWFADTYGGKETKYKGNAGINYGGIWLFAEKGAPEPSTGHAIDHIGFRPIDVDAAVAALKAKNVKIITEPRPLTLPSGTKMRLAFAEGPDGVRIEMVQRDNLK
jgi:catechol 2,3-dioxygenase-like lactoylglutathione lyase family enzyme/predicted enzyme related to lactoylglutathione lyase